MLGIPPESVRVVVGDVGGGFGMKTTLYAEDVLAAYCARKLKRPVKWTADRIEEFLSASQGRDLNSKVELALDANGRILALRVSSRANLGAYATPAGVVIQLLIGPWVATSVYDIQTIDIRIRGVLTNTTPTGPYRGAGRPEAIYMIERLMDAAARQTGIDRIELRRRNFIRPAQMPYLNPMAKTYDSGQFEKVMDRALALADWNGFAARAANAKRRGMLRGQGIATFLEWTGADVFNERVTVTVSGDGFIEMFSATQGMGQGLLTTYAQLAVDVFGVPIDRIRIVQGDTDRGTGFGSAGSRSLFVGGSAVYVAAKETVDKAKSLAAQELEAAAGDIEYARRRVPHRRHRSAHRPVRARARQPDRRIVLDSTSSVADATWPNGCHICEVEIDPDTGEVEIDGYWSVNDVGRVVNPMIVKGQLEGGALQGIGQALCERIVYDRETGQPLTGTLMDYALPRRGHGQALRDDDGRVDAVPEQPARRERRGRAWDDRCDADVRQCRVRCARAGGSFRAERAADADDRGGRATGVEKRAGVRVRDAVAMNDANDHRGRTFHSEVDPNSGSFRRDLRRRGVLRSRPLP